MKRSAVPKAAGELPFRARDLIFASAGLLVASPLILAAAALVKVDSPGPSFFQQIRVGRGGRPFAILKLRTMSSDSSRDSIAAAQDQRVTRVGRFLRKWKIDELPQLANVVAGDMSLVGPRPELPSYVKEWPRQDREAVLSIRPGVTDDASLKFRNEAELLEGESDVHAAYVEKILPEKLALNVEYVRSRSLRRDFVILFQTVAAVLNPGASGVVGADESGMMEPGRGRTVVFSTTTCPGSQSLYRGQLAWMKSRGWRPVLVSSPDAAATALADREGVPLVGIQMEREIAPVSDLVALLRWVRTLLRLRPHAVNVGTPKAGLLGTVAAWLVGVPQRVYTVRGLRLESESGLRLALLWAAEKLAVSCATEVVSVSHSLADELVRRHLVPVQKVRVIGSGSSNGVDAAAVADRAAERTRVEIRDELGVPDDCFLVGFVGRVGADKGVDTLLEASRLTSDDRVHWLLVGRPEDPSLVARVRSAGPQVHWLEWSDNLWGLLPAMDVLALPTLREGFPNVVLEAGAAGVPAIVTRATGSIDSVLHGRTGLLIDVGDSAALAAEVTALSEDEPRLRSMGARARERAFKEFAQEPIWTGVEEIMAGGTLDE